MTGLDEETEDPLQSRAGGTQAELLTARLAMRTPRDDDARAVALLANNPKVARMTRSMPWPYGEADALAWFARLRASRGAVCAWLLEKRDGGSLVGAAGFGASPEGGTEIGYWLGEDHWGTGFATEAAQRVVDEAFGVVATARLHGSCIAGNMASRRVLEKCGFQYAGAGMLTIASRRGAVPTEDFILERAVWVALKNWTGK